MQLNTRLLYLICSCEKLSKKQLSFIFSKLEQYGKEVDEEILCYLSNSKLNNLGTIISRLRNTKYEPWLIPIILHNYKTIYFEFIKKIFSKIKINYCNSTYWYECEESLIKHFKKKNPDKRLLKYVLKFYKEGLCSESRYALIKILLKYDLITKFDLSILQNDSNEKTRNLAHKILKNNCKSAR